MGAAWETEGISQQPSPGTHGPMCLMSLPRLHRHAQNLVLRGQRSVKGLDQGSFAQRALCLDPLSLTHPVNIHRTRQILCPASPPRCKVVSQGLPRSRANRHSDTAPSACYRTRQPCENTLGTKAGGFWVGSAPQARSHQLQSGPRLSFRTAHGGC